jgi:hypothetical protein
MARELVNRQSKLRAIRTTSNGDVIDPSLQHNQFVFFSYPKSKTASIHINQHKSQIGKVITRNTMSYSAWDLMANVVNILGDAPSY